MPPGLPTPYCLSPAAARSSSFLTRASARRPRRRTVEPTMSGRTPSSPLRSAVTSPVRRVARASPGSKPKAIHEMASASHPKVSAHSFASPKCSKRQPSSPGAERRGGLRSRLAVSSWALSNISGGGSGMPSGAGAG